MKHLSFFISIIVLIFISELTYAEYSIIDYPGAKYTLLEDINDNGSIAGNYIDADDNWHSFIYKNNSFTIIAHPDGGVTYVNGINNSECIVGTYGDGNGERGFLYDGDKYINIDYPEAKKTVPIGINDYNQIVGYYAGKSDNGTYGFMYDGKTFMTINRPDSKGTQLFGINNHGDIVGYSYPPQVSYIYDGVTYTTINYPSNNSTSTLVTDVNDAGEVVGTYNILTDGITTGWYGFFFDGNSYRDINYPADFRTNFVNGINNNGDMVGYFQSKDGLSMHGFIYTDDDSDSGSGGCFILDTAIIGMPN